MGAGLAHRSHQVVCLGIGLFDQVRKDLGVGLALKVMAAALQLLTQLGEVLDDAVVDDGDATVAAGVGMGVDNGGLAVGSPAGVADAAGGVAVDIGKFALQARDLAHAANDVEVSRRALAHLECDARGVIAAIFHTLKARDKDILCNIRAGVADNSAHRINLTQAQADIPEVVSQLRYHPMHTRSAGPNRHKGACPLRGGRAGNSVCPDKTCQNKPVPNWQVLTP